MIVFSPKYYPNQMDQILRRTTSLISQNIRPTMDLVGGNDKTFKMLLASKLVDAKMPLDFDHVNGITILSGEQGQVTVLGSNERYLAQMEQLLTCEYRHAVVVLSLATPSESADYLEGWLQALKQHPGGRCVIVTEWEMARARDPQTAELALQYMRLQCARVGVKFFTIFSSAMLFEALPLIGSGNVENTPSNVADKKAHKYFIYTPEPHQTDLFQKTSDLFRQHVYQQRKNTKTIENLSDYLAYIEQASKCGSDFSEFTVKQ